MALDELSPATLSFLRGHGLVPGSEPATASESVEGHGSPSVQSYGAEASHSPLYEGSDVLVSVRFSVPRVGLARSMWPPADPGSVTLTWIGGRKADPVTWLYGAGEEITKVGTGVYSANLGLANRGKWRVKWVGTRPLAAVVAHEFTVHKQPF